MAPHLLAWFASTVLLAHANQAIPPKEVLLVRDGTTSISDSEQRLLQPKLPSEVVLLKTSGDYFVDDSDPGVLVLISTKVHVVAKLIHSTRLFRAIGKVGSQTLMSQMQGQDRDAVDYFMTRFSTPHEKFSGSERFAIEGDVRITFESKGKRFSISTPSDQGNDPGQALSFLAANPVTAPPQPKAQVRPVPVIDACEFVLPSAIRDPGERTKHLLRASRFLSDEVERLGEKCTAAFKDCTREFSERNTELLTSTFQVGDSIKDSTSPAAQAMRRTLERSFQAFGFESQQAALDAWGSAKVVDCSLNLYLSFGYATERGTTVRNVQIGGQRF